MADDSSVLRTRFLPGLMLLGAGLLTAIAAAIMLLPGEESVPPAPAAHTPTAGQLGIVSVQYPTPLPTRPPQIEIPPVDWAQPTADSVAIASALDLPIAASETGASVQRVLEPLTIIPVRSRSEIITYSVQAGDTLRTIAERFGLQQSTIIWSNSRFYVNRMQIGMELTILPIDGVYYQVEEPQTVQVVAETYQVDPYAIIDSEYNVLAGATPNTLLPAGLYVVVPGGQGTTEPVYWDPGIVMSSDGSAGAVLGHASFGVGDPGSCGRQPVRNGSPPFSAPIRASYRVTQDFSWEHGGIDLAVPEGTGVFAAGGGTVIFAGWSTWGYGYTVVIAHGSTLTIYGHLNGPLVSCGQVVSAGDGIGVTGTSGRSSGPHLHFEIRGADGKPTSPWNYQAF